MTFDEITERGHRRDARYCDQGCGYKLPEEYSDDETTCGACLNETEEQEPWP